MKQDGSAGTPRQPKGPPDEGQAFQFHDEKEAFDYVVGRGRSHEQLTKLVAAAEMGLAISAVMDLVDKNLWVVGDRGPAAKPEVGALPQTVGFIQKPPISFSGSMARTVRFANVGIEFIDATRKLVAVAKEMKRIFAANPGLQDSLLKWKLPKQMMTALMICVAQDEKLEPGLTYREMEAVALLVGFREPAEEFALSTERQEDAWRHLKKTIEDTLLPILRSLKIDELGEPIGVERKPT